MMISAKKHLLTLLITSTLCSNLISEDILDLMNQLQRGEREFVSNPSKFSNWNYGQISGLEGTPVDPSALESSPQEGGGLNFSSDSDGLGLDLGSEESDSEGNLDNEGLSKSKATTERSNQKFLINQGDQTSKAPTYITIQSSFTMQELVNALNKGGFEVSISEKSKNLLPSRFQVFFDKAPLDVLLKWISATTGQTASLQNRKISI